MELKRFVIYPIATSCAGKSTLTKALSEKLPDIYTVSYDKLKWQLAGYHRDKHRSLIKEITFGLFEVICSKYIPILLDVSLQDEAEYPTFHFLIVSSFKPLFFKYFLPNPVLKYFSLLIAFFSSKQAS